MKLKLTQKRRRVDFFLAFSFISITACSNSTLVPESKKSSPFQSSPTPSQTPPEEKPPEVWKCAYSNGEGRVFRAALESRNLSEAKAREDCQIYSRHCVILDCQLAE